MDLLFDIIELFDLRIDFKVESKITTFILFITTVSIPVYINSQLPNLIHTSFNNKDILHPKWLYYKSKAGTFVINYMVAFFSFVAVYTIRKGVIEQSWITIKCEGSTLLIIVLSVFCGIGLLIEFIIANYRLTKYWNKIIKLKNPGKMFHFK